MSTGTGPRMRCDGSRNACGARARARGRERPARGRTRPGSGWRPSWRPPGGCSIACGLRRQGDGAGRPADAGEPSGDRPSGGEPSPASRARERSRSGGRALGRGRERGRHAALPTGRQGGPPEDAGASRRTRGRRRRPSWPQHPGLLRALGGGRIPASRADLERWARQWRSRSAPGTDPARLDFARWTSLRRDLDHRPATLREGPRARARRTVRSATATRRRRTMRCRSATAASWSSTTGRSPTRGPSRDATRRLLAVVGDAWGWSRRLAVAAGWGYLRPVATLVAVAPGIVDRAPVRGLPADSPPARPARCGKSPRSADRPVLAILLDRVAQHGHRRRGRRAPPRCGGGGAPRRR